MSAAHLFLAWRESCFARVGAAAAAAAAVDAGAAAVYGGFDGIASAVTSLFGNVVMLCLAAWLRSEFRVPS